MNDIVHENSLIAISNATAKEHKKRLSRYKLYIPMAFACSIAPICFLIYFICAAGAYNRMVGIISFAAVSAAAAIICTVLLVRLFQLAKESSDIVKRFIADGGKLKKESALEIFCLTCVKIMFTILAAFLVCAVPVSITVCYGMPFIDAIEYIGSCFAGYWGAINVPQGLFANIIGMGVMALITAAILIVVKIVNKFTQ